MMTRMLSLRNSIALAGELDSSGVCRSVLRMVLFYLIPMLGHGMSKQRGLATTG